MTKFFWPFTMSHSPGPVCCKCRNTHQRWPTLALSAEGKLMIHTVQKRSFGWKYKEFSCSWNLFCEGGNSDNIWNPSTGHGHSCPGPRLRQCVCHLQKFLIIKQKCYLEKICIPPGPEGKPQLYSGIPSTQPPPHHPALVVQPLPQGLQGSHPAINDHLR